MTVVHAKRQKKKGEGGERARSDFSDCSSVERSILNSDEFA